MVPKVIASFIRRSRLFPDYTIKISSLTLATVIYEADRKIMASEYTVNGSLIEHLSHPDKRRFLTLADRLKICIGAARGLKYLDWVLVKTA